MYEIWDNVYVIVGIMMMFIMFCIAGLFNVSHSP